MRQETADTNAAAAAVAELEAEVARLRGHLEASEGAYRTLLNSIADAVLVADGAGRYQDVNPAAEQLLGYTRAELLQLTVADLAVDLGAIQRSFEALTARGVSEVEVEMRCKDGAVVPVHVHASVAWVTGAPRYIAIMRDLRAWREAEEALRMVKSAFEQASDAILLTIALPAWPTVVYANPAYTRLTGYTLEEIVGRGPEAQIGPATDEETLRRMREAVSAGLPFTAELITYRRDSSTYLAEWSVTPMQDQHGVMTHLVVVHRDVTAERAAERLARRQRAFFEQLATDAALDEVLETLTLMIEEQAPGSLCAIMLLDAECGTLHTGAAPSLPPAYTAQVDGVRIGPMAGSCGTAVYTGTMVLVDDIATDSRWESWRELALAHGLRACWSVPFFDRQGAVLGTYAIYVREPRMPDEQTLALASDAAHLAAVAVERRRDDTKLRRSQARLAAIIDSAIDAIVAVDKDLRIVLFNPAAERMFRLPAAAAIGLPVAHFVPERYNATHYRGVTSFVGSSGTHTRRISQPLTARRNDGTEFPMEATVARAEVDGELIATVIMRDMTAQVEIERALRQSEERFAKAFRASPLGIGIARLSDRCIIDVNDSLARVIGVTPPSLIGQVATDFPFGLDGGDRAEMLRAVQDGLPMREVEMRWRTTAGAIRTVLVSIERIEIGGEPHLLLLTDDVTERRRLELELRQAQKMESIGQLAGGIAHDFNNQLMVILGSLEMVREELPAESPLQADLHEAEAAGRRAANLTRQLLAFARKQLLEPVIADLNELLRHLSTMLRRLIGEHIELHLELTPTLGLVRVDPGQIEQVITNLVINARDAMPSGGMVVLRTADRVVDARRSPPLPGLAPATYSTITVADNGVGMTPEVLTHVFEPFFTTKELGKGVGLGLATSYGIVKQHSGYIDVTSAPGSGTTWTIYLPQVSGAAREQPAQPSEELPGGSETVLLIEDEPAVRALAARVLRRCGYTVLEASHGKEALEIALASDERIDLLLSDIVMPHLSGIEVALRLREARPGMSVVLMSGYTTVIDAQQGRAALDDAPLLLKPFSPLQLALAVRGALDRA
ncbi:MAG: hypothetical protein RLZZ387_4027 [Chloroflexota bacterium]